MSNNTPPLLYALTPIEQTEGLEDDYYNISDGFAKRQYLTHFKEGKWLWDSYKHGAELVEYGITHYLRPLPEGTRVLKPGELDMAIEFHEWVGKQGYKLSHYAAKGEAVHLHESKGSTPFHELKDNDYCTTEELYNKFIQTKLAQMGE